MTREIIDFKSISKVDYFIFAFSLVQQLCHSGLVRHRSPVVALAWGQVEHRRMQLASSDASGEVGFFLTRFVIDFFAADYILGCDVRGSF